MALSKQDTFAVQELVAIMYAALDAADPVAYSEVFATDGVFTTPFMECAGRDSIRKFLEGRIAEGGTKGVRYFVTNSLVEPHAEGARYRSYLIQMSVDVGPTIRGTGSFDAIVVQTDSGWLFKQLTLSIDTVTAP